MSAITLLHAVDDRQTPPTIYDCPNKIYVEAAPRPTLYNVKFTAPTATDASTGNPVTNVTSNFGLQTSVVMFVNSAIPVEYVFTDSSGNEARCAFVIAASSTYMYTKSNYDSLKITKLLHFNFERFQHTCTLYA